MPTCILHTCIHEDVKLLYMYETVSNRCQQSESEHVQCDVVGSTGHHLHLILQLLGTGLGVHLHQTRLQQMLSGGKRGREKEGGKEREGEGRRGREGGEREGERGKEREGRRGREVGGETQSKFP